MDEGRFVTRDQFAVDTLESIVSFSENDATVIVRKPFGERTDGVVPDRMNG